MTDQNDPMMGERWVVDNDPCERYPLFTRANIGEVFPDVVMPLSWTIWGVPHAEPGWREAFANIGAFDLDEFTPGQMETLGVFGGYGYLNATTSRIFGVRTPGLSAEAIDASFFGENPHVPPYAAKPTDESPAHAERLGAMLNMLFTTNALPELETMQAEVKAIRAARPDFAAMSEAALLAHMRDLVAKHWRRYWVRHIMATYHAMVPPGVIGGVCAAVGRGEQAMNIMAGIGGVDSALPANALWDLSRAVKASPELSALFDSAGTGIAGALAGASGADVDAFKADFAAFIAEYGYRGPQEWEMRSTTFGIDPATPLAAINQMRRSPNSESPSVRNDAKKAERDVLVDEISAMLAEQPEVQGQFLAGIQAATVFLAARERTKTNCAILTHEMRLAMWELGRRFVARGVFTAADQFALLTDGEWSEVVANPEAAGPLIAKREQQYAHLAGLEPPFIVNGVVPPLDTWAKRQTTGEAASIGTVLQGAPGATGIARGRAVIIDHPSDPKDLEPGDVLVADSTDPSWTPLFAVAGAVVVNVGATVSHAVIVARELGVPCAISVTGATLRIPHGAIIEVDGGRGTVTIVG
jgi:rifampicin phosphotransferase